MENKSVDTQDTSPETTELQNNKIGLPLLALTLVIIPALLALLNMLGLYLPPFAALIMIISPIIGLVLGIMALDKKDGQIGKARKILATTAIAIPLIFVAIILIIFIFMLIVVSTTQGM